MGRSSQIILQIAVKVGGVDSVLSLLRHGADVNRATHLVLHRCHCQFSF